MPGPVLSGQLEALVREERAVLTELRALLERFGADRSDTAALDQAAQDLEDLFLLVVVGEFNAGKSAFINALLGAPVLEEGATPTTSAVTVLRYGETASEEARGEALTERTYPAEFLRDLAIVDTPGTNAIIRRHEEITRSFIPRSDLVLFITSADRPFSESERAFLQLIRDWGKKTVVVLNKIDLLAPADLQRVVGFIQGNANALLGFLPDVFPVAGKVAQRAALAPTAEDQTRLRAESGMDAFEQFLRTTLDERGRVRIKLESPLGVAARLLGTYSGAADQRQALLHDDVAAIQGMVQQIDGYQEDMRRDFAVRLDQIDAVIYEMDERADLYFEETIRLGRVFDLMNTQRMRTSFEEAVVADTAARIDRSVQDIVDWMSDQELRIRQQLLTTLHRRREAGGGDRVPTGPDAEFGSSRRELLGNVTHAATTLVQRYDQSAEARQLADSMRQAVTQTALVGAGALSLGTAIAVAVGTAAADITGVLAAGVVAGLGLLIIPAKRRRARLEFHERSTDLRGRLRASLGEQFERELVHATDRIRAIMAPYERFVRAETGSIDQLQEELARLRAANGRLKRAVELL